MTFKKHYSVKTRLKCTNCGAYYQTMPSAHPHDSNKVFVRQARTETKVRERPLRGDIEVTDDVTHQWIRPCHECGATAYEEVTVYSQDEELPQDLY